MLIGRSDDPQNPRRVAATKVTFPFGSGSRNPSGPAAAGRTNRPDTRPQTAPHQDSFRSPLAPTGPSTHALRLLIEDDLDVARALLANPDIGVTQIAHRLGVSPATLYRYIPAARSANTLGEGR